MEAQPSGLMTEYTEYCSINTWSATEMANAAGATLANDGADDGHFELCHFKMLRPMASDWPPLLSVNAGIGTWVSTR